MMSLSFRLRRTLGKSTSKVRLPLHGSYENGFLRDLSTTIATENLYNTYRIPFTVIQIILQSEYPAGRTDFRY